MNHIKIFKSYNRINTAYSASEIMGYVIESEQTKHILEKRIQIL